MSYKIGYRDKNYVLGRNDDFIYGMRWVYIAAGSISLIGAGLTFFRLYNRKYKLKNNTISTKSIS